MSIKNLFLAVRPWSLSASLIPSVIGLILADKSKPLSGNFLLSFFSVVTVILVQAAGNLVNTYYDFVNGIDKQVKANDEEKSESSSGDITLTDNILTINQLVELLLTCYIASVITLVFVMIASPARSETLILLYALGLASSYFYTGGVSLKYKALGDLVILVTFGPLISEFTFASCCGHVSMTPIYISIPLSVNAESILHVNNMRDIKSDKEAGIHTLVMFLGIKLSNLTMAIFLVTPYIFLFFAVYYTRNWLFLLPCLTVGTANDIYKLVCASRFISLPEKVAKFHLIFGIFYIITLYFCGNRALGLT